MRRGAFFLILLLVLTFVTFKISHAFFVSNAVSQNNTFTTAAAFPTPIESGPVATSSSHLVINEVSPLGEDEVEWVELYNPTSSPINLNGWSIKDATNNPDALPDVNIPAGGYAVLVSNDTSINTATLSATIITLDANGVGSGLNNSGGDSIELLNGTISIDTMNYGNVTTFFSGGPTIPVLGNTISRIPNGVDSDSGSDWQTNTVSTIGVSNN